MKRIKAACIVQTLHFQLKEDVGESYAKTLVQQDVKAYKEKLTKAGTKHKIISEETQEDGSVILEIKKQYNTSPIGDYLK
ncbi:MAG: hypothetical protein LUK37_22485 [Clostridia bacterium]|nr:hypothetical protein [Clostridia bacterium]